MTKHLFKKGDLAFLIKKESHHFSCNKVKITAVQYDAKSYAVKYISGNGAAVCNEDQLLTAHMLAEKAKEFAQLSIF